MKTTLSVILTLTMLNTMAQTPKRKGYAPVNGINIYYEVYGEGNPLVLIHGGGSTIETSFGRIIPLLAKKRQVIALELQAHGRTSDRNQDSSFEQDADDVNGLLKYLKINKADFLGFSNGGTTAIQIAIRHPEMVEKLVLGSALAKRNGVPEQFWDFMKQTSIENMPPQLKEAYLKVSPNPSGFQTMHDRDAKRMIDFLDIPDDQIRKIKSPALIIIGDKDVVRPEHALELKELLPGSELAILPGVHGEYLEEVTTLNTGSLQAGITVQLIENFLR